MDTTEILTAIAAFVAFGSVIGAAMVAAMAGIKNWKRARGVV